MTYKTLVGHDSPETAYVVEDYPYGFRLRCRKRYWIETVVGKGKGQRLVSQTTNPKRGDVWNKPVKSTYSTVQVMYLDEIDVEGKKIIAVCHQGLPNPYDGVEKLDAWLAQFDPAAFADKYRNETINLFRKFMVAYAAKRAAASTS